MVSLEVIVSDVMWTSVVFCVVNGSARIDIWSSCGILNDLSSRLFMKISFPARIYMKRVAKMMTLES